VPTLRQSLVGKSTGDYSEEPENDKHAPTDADRVERPPRCSNERTAQTYDRESDRIRVFKNVAQATGRMPSGHVHESTVALRESHG
jgi:hypothetical protein